MAKYETPEEAQLKLDLRYGRIAKRRIKKIDDAMSLHKAIMNMDDDEFDKFVADLKKMRHATSMLTPQEKGQLLQKYDAKQAEKGAKKKQQQQNKQQPKQQQNKQGQSHNNSNN